MIEITGLEKIDKLVKELAAFKNKGLEATAKEVLKKQANIAASQMRNNVKAMTLKTGSKTLRKSIRVRAIKRRRAVIGYKIIVLKRLLDRKPLKAGQKPFYYALALEYGHINKGWNAKGKNRTAPRNFIEKTRKQIEANNIDEKNTNKGRKKLN